MTRQAGLVRARKFPRKLGMSSNIQLPSLRVLGLAFQHGQQPTSDERGSLVIKPNV